MKKIKYIVSFLLFFCIFNIKVKAQNYYFTNNIINDLYYKIIYDNNTIIKKANYIKNKINYDLVFSLDPLISVDEASIYKEYLVKDKELFNLNNDLFNQINAIIYYGNMYIESSNNANLYYVLTQLLVWRVNNLDYEIYLCDDTGTIINTYNEEIDNILEEANDYLPNNTNHYLSVGYIRPVLLKYKYEYENIISDGLYEDELGRIQLGEYKSGTNTYQISQGYENSATFYSNSNNSYLIKVNKLPLIIHNYVIEVKHNTLNINFNIDTKYYSNSSTISSYGIYNTYNELVKEIIIDNNSYNIDLDYGNYYLKQLNKGIYKEDNNIYEFKINDTSSNITINLEKQTKDINISLKYCQFETCKDDKAKFIITDGIKDIDLTFNGNTSIKLGLGKYYIKQSGEKNPPATAIATFFEYKLPIELIKKS